MTVALAGSAPATYEIKSANLPLVALLLKSGDLPALSQDLERQFGEAPNFFDHDPVVIDLAALPGAETAVDFAALLALLRRYRMAPIAVKGGSALQMEAAVAAGLTAAPDAIARASTKPVVETVVQEIVHEVIREVPVAGPGALVIDKPLRSGQQVYAKGRDLVVLSMVNVGAEVIADGHIHVYAPLRGKAIAGARGNTEARIFSLCLEAELISIAGTYRTSETPLPKNIWAQPAQIRLVGEKLVMDLLKT
ncbi:MAG TPA: septum site-determining protein MinC [Burkholderiaceae bacterium]|nr:septum site-determining protein MinC [Burkholderiaceae bacterium]